MDDKLTLQLLLMAEDRMSPALALAVTNLNRFKSQANQAAPAMGDLEEKMEDTSNASSRLSSAFAGIGTQILEMGVNALFSGFQKLSGAIDEAGKFQTRTLMTSSDIASQLGVSFEEAGDRVEGMQQKLSKASAALPGTTQDYVDLFNTLGGTSATVFKGKPEEWANQTEDMVKRLGILASGSVGSGHGNEVGSVIARAISGSAGFGELATNDIIQKNTLFRQAILDQLTKLGIEQDKWKDLTSDQRFSILSEAVKVATPDSLINKFNGTYESVTEGFKTYWFDPLSGVFGVLKKVNVGNGGGMRSLLMSWTDTINALGALGSAGLDAIGFDVDEPMRMMINFLDGFSLFIRNTAAAIRLAPFTDGNLGNLEAMKSIVLNFFNGAIESFSNGVANFDVGGTADMIKSLISGLVGIVNNINWNQIGMMLGWFVSKLLVTGLDIIFSGEFLRYMWAGIKMSAGFFFGILEGLAGGLVKELADGFDHFWDTVFKSLGDIWNGFVSKIADFFQGIWNKLSSAASSLGNIISNPVQAIIHPAVDAAKNIPLIGGAIGELDKLGIFGGKPGADVTTGNAVTQPPGTPLNQPPTTTNSKKVASNVFAPVINVTTADHKQVAFNVLDALGGAYATFREGAA